MESILAAVMPRPNDQVETREYPKPELEPDSALLRVELSEVCGTDVYLQQGRLAGVPYPLIPGHVSVGELAEIRGRMRDVNGRAFSEGDRITFLDVHGTCNSCWYCLVAKATTRCPHRKVYGITYGAEDGLCGGWSQYVYLKPGTKCIHLGTADYERFMAGGCSLPTALHALDRAEVRIGDRVLVLGSGPVGLSCMILAARSGASKVLCLGAPQSRLEVAEALGAEVLNIEESSEADRYAWILDATRGRGADVSIEATGNPRAVVQAMRWTRDGGRLVVVGQYTDHGELPFNPHLDLNRKHLEIRGSWGSDFSHFFRGVELMSDPRWARDWKNVPMVKHSLWQCQEALEAVASGTVMKALIDPWMPMGNQDL